MREAEVELVWLLAKGLQVVEENRQALRIGGAAGAPWRGFSQEIWEERGQLHWPPGWCLCLALCNAGAAAGLECCPPTVPASPPPNFRPGHLAHTWLLLGKPRLAARVV